MEFWMFVVGILLFVAVLSGKLSYRYGAPALLLFLLVGLLWGNLETLYGVNDTIAQDDEISRYSLANMVATISLAIILFAGGVGTKVSSIRPVLGPGVTLATAGVLLTALLTGVFIYFVSPLIGHEMSVALSLLMAATMASTDSASVFSILRTKKQGLTQNLRPLLELESGSNDPMAYVMVVMLTDLAVGQQTGGVEWYAIIGTFFLQMVLGAVLGMVVGKLAERAINKIQLNTESLYSVLLVAFGFMSYSLTSMLGGNGYLAVYITGVVLGNSKLGHKNTMTTFLDSFMWLLQIVLFLTLGSLADIHMIIRPEVYLTALAIGGFMIVVARPLATFLTMLPFRNFTPKARLYTSWVGLRGAVPIVFVLYAIEHQVPDCEFIFTVVFLCTLISLIIQGTTVSSMADWLGLSEENQESTFSMTTLNDQVKSEFTEIEVNESLLANGNTLQSLSFPGSTIVFMVCRDGSYFVPKGRTELEVGDKLLVVSDNNGEFRERLEDLGVKNIYEVE